MRDNCRIVLQGTFCEQPPLNLIKSIELAGCYIVDDEFMLTHRWLLEEFRVSKFAQQLGTREKVSVKRLKEAWRRIGQVRA